MCSLTVLELEVQDQGVGKAGFSQGLSPWHVDGRLLPVSSHGHPAVHVCVLNSSYKDTSPMGLGLHFTFITSLKTLSPNRVTF